MSQVWDSLFGPSTLGTLNNQSENLDNKMARKSVAYKRGRVFAAVGWGKYGPYAVGT